MPTLVPSLEVPQQRREGEWEQTRQMIDLLCIPLTAEQRRFFLSGCRFGMKRMEGLLERPVGGDLAHDPGGDAEFMKAAMAEQEA